MKVAVLAGGYGTRLGVETDLKPKPMVEIGGQPILWHLMGHYAHFGFNDFYVALGYRGEYIKRYTSEQLSVQGSIRADFSTGTIQPVDHNRKDWKINLIDTGSRTLTAGRIKRLQPHIGNEPFMLTWGDGLSDVDLHKLIEFHRSHGKLATVTAVRPPARYGHLEIGAGGEITEFSEKPQTAEGWINGAFFVLEPGIFDYINGDQQMWEHAPMTNLARDGQLMAYRHEGFWQCMDTRRDLQVLENIWASGDVPWKFNAD